MEIQGWQYYNHAAIPTTAPYEEPDITPIQNGSIWKVKGRPLLARWTTEFDCGYETNWWYVIKDAPFDIGDLKSKRRYEINKGIKFFDARVIDPTNCKEELYEIQVAAFSAYPEKYRPTVEKDAFIKGINGWNKYTVFGAFFRETGKLAGYAFCKESTCRFVDFSVLKTIPEYEKYAINAALVAGTLSHYTKLLEAGGILCDGARSINHETAFQDYLEKYFGFRKAYCKLHIVYRPRIQLIVKIFFCYAEY